MLNADVQNKACTDLAILRVEPRIMTNERRIRPAALNRKNDSKEKDNPGDPSTIERTTHDPIPSRTGASDGESKLRPETSDGRSV